jgi:hypothetical protein
MTTKIKDYGLRFYVRDLYLRRSGIRGGSTFIKSAKKREATQAINQPNKVLESLDEKFAISQN